MGAWGGEEVSGTDNGAGCEASGNPRHWCPLCSGSVPDGDWGSREVTELCQVGGGQPPEPSGLIQPSAKCNEEKLGLAEIRPGGESPGDGWFGVVEDTLLPPWSGGVAGQNSAQCFCLSV